MDIFLHSKGTDVLAIGRIFSVQPGQGVQFSELAWLRDLKTRFIVQRDAVRCRTTLTDAITWLIHHHSDHMLTKSPVAIIRLRITAAIS